MNLIKKIMQDPLNNKIITLLLYLFPALVVIRAIRGIEYLYFLLIPIFLISIFLVLLNIKENIANYKNLILIILLFPVYTFLSSIWSLNSNYTLIRSIFNLFLYTGIIALLVNYFIYEKNNFLKFLVPANIFLILACVLSLILNIPHDSWTGGSGFGFRGFAAHQNTLASLLLFTLPGLTFLIYHNRKELRIIGSILFFINVIMILLTYSRAVLLSLFTGLILFFIFQMNFKSLIGLFSIIILISIIALLNSDIRGLGGDIIFKGSDNFFSRRESLWQASLKAAKVGGMFGLGYGISAPEIKILSGSGSYYKDGIYVREKGNSILAIIEETGIAGFILFILPILFFFINVSSQNIFKLSLTLKTTLVFICSSIIHSQFEAWWVGVGSTQLPIFLFILIGGIFTNYKINENKNY